jgi:hypothetical protein
MSRVTKKQSYTLPHGRAVEIPAGLRVIPALNLPADSKIKFWLADMTAEMSSDAEIESHYRNYGFGFNDKEVELKSTFLARTATPAPPHRPFIRLQGLRSKVC